MLNGFTSINLTKLDVMQDLDEVKIGALCAGAAMRGRRQALPDVLTRGGAGVGYKLRGQRLPLGAMPSTLEELAAVEVEYESACARPHTPASLRRPPHALPPCASAAWVEAGHQPGSHRGRSACQRACLREAHRGGGRVPRVLGGRGCGQVRPPPLPVARAQASNALALGWVSRRQDMATNF